MLTMLPTRVGIEPIDDPDFSEGGIYIGHAKDRCDQGIVKYVGSEVKTLQVGDHVLFHGYSGTLMQLEDEGRLIIMEEVSITAIITSDKTTVVPGLFFRDRDGEYFPATVEMSTYLIAKAIESVTPVKWTPGQSKRDGAPIY